MFSWALDGVRREQANGIIIEGLVCLLSCRAALAGTPVRSAAGELACTCPSRTRSLFILKDMKAFKKKDVFFHLMYLLWCLQCALPSQGGDRSNPWRGSELVSVWLPKPGLRGGYENDVFSQVYSELKKLFMYICLIAPLTLEGCCTGALLLSRHLLRSLAAGCVSPLFQFTPVWVMPGMTGAGKVLSPLYLKSAPVVLNDPKFVYGRSWLASWELLLWLWPALPTPSTSWMSARSGRGALTSSTRPVSSTFPRPSVTAWYR